MSVPPKQIWKSFASGLTWLCLLLPLSISIGISAFGDENNPAKPAEPEAPDPRLLQGFLRDLLRDPKANAGRRRGMRGVAPGVSAVDDNLTNTRDLVDSRAPRDAKVEQLLQAADLAVRQKNWKSAVDLVQRLLDQPDDSLHRSADGQWQSIHRTANQMLGRLPAATLVEYQSQYAGLAQQQLTAARRSGLTADFVNVATRFFHTPAGYEAAHYLGTQHLDRSEFGLAAKWFEELAESPAVVARQDPWLLQAAYALKQSGDSKGAAEMLNRLSHGSSTIVALGTGSVAASEWLNQSADQSGAPEVLALADWTQLYGTSSRNGTSVGGDALLSPNWSLPLTSSHLVRNLVKWLVHDLQDQQRALIMAAAPLVIDGKVIYRDLRGMRCADIESGRTVWESVEGVSPERILGGLPSQQIDPQDAWRLQINPFQNTGDYQGMSAEYSPLASLLFRDGTYGLISSDGKQLFVIEDHGILSRNQPGQHWGWDGNTEPQDPFGLPWKTNRLVSYELSTGRTLWSIGGSESRESFDLPLAGSYIYGTPAVDGSELFLVAGKGDDIRLWSLDRRTGLPKWSQLIAYSDTKIDLDIARRWVTSQVAVGSGVIICPTTVGWLVAVDRMRQSVLWAHRYSPRSEANAVEREQGTQFLPQRELNALWSPSAPIISGSYVVYTPQEEPQLICLNAVDGRRLWEQPKQQGLYLAGVFDQKVVIVGETGVTAFHLATGETAWTTPFEEGIRPSGRGVVVDDHFFLPLGNGALVAIGLANGQIVSQTFVGTRQPSLGNLAMHQGKLVSLSPTGLTAFGQRDAVLAEIQRRLAIDSNDPWALLSTSEIHVLNHQYAEALPLLRRIAINKLTTHEQTRQHAALVESLSTLARSDILNRKLELDELGRIATSSAERLQYHELTAERLLAERMPVEAFEVFAKLAEEDGDTFVVRTDDRHVTARRTVWLSGRMSEVWSATPETERRSIDDRIKKLIAESAEKNAEACQRIGTLFAFHPAAIKARQRFVEWLVQSRDLAGARLLLQQLIEHSDPSVAGNATERLARLMVQSRLPADAVYYYRQLESKYSDVIVLDGKTGATLAGQARAAGELNFEPRPRGVIWKDGRLRLEQSMVNYTQPSQDVIHETSLPFFDRVNIESYQNEQRMAFESAATGQVEWMIPLRGAVRSVDEGYLTTSHIGHQLFFVNRGVLHAVSPIERKILWSKSLEDQGDTNVQVRHSSRPAMSPMIAPGRDDTSQSLLLQHAFTMGHLAVVDPNYLCLYGRRSLSVLDPRTGDELWKLDGLPMNAQVVGNREALFAVVPGKSDVLVYRTMDGKLLDVPDAGKLLNSALLSHGSSLLLLEQVGTNPLGIKRSKLVKTMLRLYNPVSKLTQWEMEFPAGTLFSPLGKEEVIAVQSRGQIQRIEIATGRVTSLEAIVLPPKRNSLPVEKYLITDDDNLYLVVNTPESGNSQYGESLASVRVSGTIYAWSRETNRFVWPEPVTLKQQNLILDRFSQMPVLLFISRSWKQRGRMSVGTLSIAAFHKQSGKKLIDVSFPSAYNGFHALSINAEEPSIDLKSYNVRMRLVATDDLGINETSGKETNPEAP